MTFPGGDAEVGIRFNVDDKELTDAERALRGFGDTGEEQQGRLTRMGGRVAGAMRDIGFAVFGAQQAFMGLKQVGGMVAGIGENFEDAFNTIQSGTGATGQALEGLKDDFRAVTAEVPQGMGEVSKALADMNTLTGATGDTLQDLTTSALDASRVMGVDTSQVVDGLARSMGAFNIEAEDGAELMNDLFTVSQNTGIGIGTLSTQMQEFGPIMKNMGFNAEETAAIFGRFHESGVNLTRIMPAINMFSRNLATEGIEDMRGAFEDVITEIQEAESSSKALNIATEAFGAEGAQRMVSAVRDGTLSMEDLNEILDETGTNLRDTAEETMTVGDHFNEMKNRVTLAFEPITMAIRGFVEDFAEWAVPRVGSAAEGIAETIMDMGQTIGEVAPGIWDALVTSAETVWDIISGVFEASISGLGSVISGAWDALRTGDWGSAIGSLVDSVRELDFGGAISAALSGIGSVASGAISGLGSIGSGIADLLLEGLDNAGIDRSGIEDFVENVGRVLENVVGVFDWSAIGDSISSFVTDAMNALSIAPDDLADYAASVGDAVAAALEALSWVSIIGSGVRAGITAAVLFGVDEEKAREYAGKVVDSLEEQFDDVDWSPVNEKINEGVYGSRETQPDSDDDRFSSLLNPLFAFKEEWLSTWEDIIEGVGNAKEAFNESFPELKAELDTLADHLKWDFDPAKGWDNLKMSLLDLAMATPVLRELVGGLALFTVTGEAFREAIGFIVEAIVGVPTRIIGDINKIIAGLGKLKDGFDTTMDFMRDLPDQFGSAVAGIVDAILSPLEGLGGEISGLGSQIADGFWSIIDQVSGWPDAMGDTISGAIGVVQSVGAQIIEGLWGGISSMSGWLLGQMMNVIEWIKSIIPDSLVALVGAGKNVIQGLWDGIASFADWLRGQALTILDWVKISPDAALNALVGVGKNLVVGIWTGISSLTGWLVGALTTWVEDNIPGPIKKALDILSPSGVMAREVGGPIVGGIAEGMRDSIPDVVGVMDDVISSIRGAAESNGGEGFGIVDNFLFGRQQDEYFRGLVDRFGELGAEVAGSLTTALAEGEGGGEVAGFVNDLMADARSAGVENAAQLGDELTSAIAKALATGSPEAVEAALEIVEKINSAIKSADVATEVGVPIVEGIADGMRDSIPEIVDVMGEIIDSMRDVGDFEGELGIVDQFLFGRQQDEYFRGLEEKFGETGAEVANALTEALATGEGGGAVANFVNDLLEEAREVGVEGVGDLGQELTDALAEALKTGSPEAVQAALDIVAEINEEITEAAGEGGEEAGRSMIEAFNDGYDEGNREIRLEEKIGSDGLRFIQSLEDAIAEGTPSAIEAIGATAAGLIDELTEGLSPDAANDLTSRFFSALKTVIETEGEEALGKLIDILAEIDAKVAEGEDAADVGGDKSGGSSGSGDDREFSNMPMVGLSGLPGQGSKSFDVPLDELEAFGNKWGIPDDVLERIVRQKHGIDVPIEDLAGWVNSRIDSGEDNDPKGDNPPPNEANREPGTFKSGPGVPEFQHGLGFVPSDNFLARLHQGEAVLNRMEADEWRRNQSAPGVGPISINLTVHNAHGMDERELAKHIRREINGELESQFGYRASQWGAA